MLRAFIFVSTLLLWIAAPLCGQNTWRAVETRGGEASTTLYPAANSTLYARLGPIWRSDDHGETWRWIADGDPSWYSTLKTHPIDPNILALGTIEGTADERVFRLMISLDGGETWAPRDSPEGHANVLGFGHDGALYVSWHGMSRSFDFGETWEPIELPVTLSVTDTPEIFANPRSTSIYARRSGRGFYSVDGGQSFNEVRGVFYDPLLRVYVSPSKPRTIAYGVFGRLRLSRDAGITFTELELDAALSDVVFHPARPDHIYVMTGNGVFRFFYASYNGGETWNKVADRGFSQDSEIWLDACDPNTLYLRDHPRTSLFRSSDSGRTWQALPAQQRGWIEEIHSVPDSCELLVRTRAGYYRVADSGTRWRRVGRGFSSSHSYEYSFDPDGERIYSHSYRGIDLSTDEGRSWTRMDNELQGWLVYRMAFGKDGFQLASTGFSVLRSWDQGNSFETLYESWGRSDFALDPFDDSRVLIFTAYQTSVAPFEPTWTLSTDSGTTRGETILIEHEGEMITPSHMRFDPYRRDVIYGILEGKGRFFRSEDGGKTFEVIGGGLWQWQWNEVVELDIAADGTLYLWQRWRVGRGISRSKDGGRTWEMLLEVDWLSDLQVDAANSEVLYAAGRPWRLGVDQWLWRSLDGGVTWDPWDEGLRQGITYSVAQSLHDPNLFLSATEMGKARKKLGEPEPCDSAEPTILCLQGGRYEVEVRWRDFQGRTGKSRWVAGGTDDSGLLYFFDPDNWEMLVKVLNGCAINDRWWLFSSATTTVSYTLSVQDRQTGKVRHYVNALGRQADAITDTLAFDTCS